MTLQEELVLKAFLMSVTVPIVGAVLTYERTNLDTMNPVFSIHFKDGHAISYEHVKLDVEGYSQLKTLSIPQDQQADKSRLLNRTVIAQWCNYHVNQDFLEEDIGHLSLNKEGVHVVMSPNSMRFRGAFTLYFL